jgi:hypothetical protein
MTFVSVPSWLPGPGTNAKARLAVFPSSGNPYAGVTFTNYSSYF